MYCRLNVSEQGAQEVAYVAARFSLLQSGRFQTEHLLELMPAVCHGMCSHLSGSVAAAIMESRA